MHSSSETVIKTTTNGLKWYRLTAKKKAGKGHQLKFQQISWKQKGLGEYGGKQQMGEATGNGGSGLSRHWEMPQHGNAKDLRKQEGKVGWKLPKFYICNTSVCPDWTLDRCQSLSLSPTLEGLFPKRLYRPPGGNSVSQYGAWKFTVDSSALLSFGILHRNKKTSFLPPFPGEKPERLCPCSLNFPSASYCFNLNLKY